MNLNTYLNNTDYKKLQDVAKRKNTTPYKIFQKLVKGYLENEE